MKRPALALGLVACIAIATPAAARDSLGIFANWGAFRDASVPRCYAIALADNSHGEAYYTPYADIGTWPGRSIRGAFHVRLPRKVDPGQKIMLTVGGQHWQLAAGGADAWSMDAHADTAIIAAMRSASTMSLAAHDNEGKVMAISWKLDGAATAMDAATLGCAGGK